MKKRCRLRNTGIHHDVVGKLLVAPWLPIESVLGYLPSPPWRWSCPGPAPESPSSALRGKKGQKMWLECKTYGWTVSEMWFDLKTQESKFRTSGTVDVLNGWGQVCLQPSHFRGYPSLTLEDHTTSSAKHVAPFLAPFLAPNIINHQSGSNYDHNMWLFNIWQYLCICIYYNVHSYPITKSELLRNGSIQYGSPCGWRSKAPDQKYGHVIDVISQKNGQLQPDKIGKPWKIVGGFQDVATMEYNVWVPLIPCRIHRQIPQKIITHGLVVSKAASPGRQGGDLAIGLKSENGMNLLESNLPYFLRFNMIQLYVFFRNHSINILQLCVSFSETAKRGPENHQRFSRDSPIPPGKKKGWMSVGLSVCLCVCICVCNVM